MLRTVFGKSTSARKGLSPLDMSNAALTAAAQKRAEEQAQCSGHTRPNGEQWETVLDDFGVTGFTAKVELCSTTGYTTPTTLVNGWMNSIERSYITGEAKEKFTQIGVGYYESEQTGKCCWVVLLVGYEVETK